MIDSICNCPKSYKRVFDNQKSICCDKCDNWYHFKCSLVDSATFNFLAENISSIWYCKLCLNEAFPFQSLNENQFRNTLANDTKKCDKLIEAVTSVKHGFIRKCNVCNKAVRDVSKATPCNDCKHLIHRKCSALQYWQTTDTHRILNQWCCITCLRSKFPFSDIDDQQLTSLTFNSNFNCPCKGNDLKLEDYRLFDLLKFNKLKLKENDLLFDNDIDNYAKFHTDFDYFTSHNFHKLSKSSKPYEGNRFSLLHTNIQSLLKNKDSLELLCNELDHNFDAIAVTETWHNNSNKHNFENLVIPGFQNYIGQISQTKCGGSGFFLSECLKVTVHSKLNKTFKNDECEFEAFWVEIDSSKDKNIVLAAVYNHPRKNPTEFLNYLDSTLKKLSKENKIVLKSGDFNIDFLRFDRNIFAEEFVNLMFSNFFQPLILQPSRYVGNERPTLIDNIIFL